MMKVKQCLRWFYEKVKTYNIFMNEFGNDDDGRQENIQINIKHERYTTRLYVILLLVTLYILFYTTLVSPNSRTVTVSKINPTIFDELSAEYGETLSCPCSTITIPYENFISNEITFHSICSSIFVSEQWIKSMYFWNASQYGINDFRTTAKAQFQLLSDFCSMSKTKISQNEIDFNNNEFVSIDLLPAIEVELRVNATVNVLKESLSTEMISFLNYLRVYIRSNYLVSSLNTNLILSTALNLNQYKISQLQVQYTANTTTGTTNADTLLCGNDNPILPVGFLNYTSTSSIYVFDRSKFISSQGNIPIVKGFFVGCTPLESILSSTLDCLYNTECVQLLSDYFPMIINISNVNHSILSSTNENKTVYNHLMNLFVDRWLTQMNYSKYFSSCHPLTCSYQTTDPINWTYAITVFISLYGGLTIILRFLAPLVIYLLFKHNYILRKKITESMKKMNIFEDENERTEENIKQQKISTRIYMVLLACSLLILVLFSLLTMSLLTRTILNPSLTTYNDYDLKYGNNLRCPCSQTIISYNSLISIHPTIHPICSSDFISDRWLKIVKNVYDHTPQDWRNIAYAQFHLLARLCQLANNTINDAIEEFLIGSLVVSNVISLKEFNKQINQTLNGFFDSTLNSFVSLIELVHLLTQIDQFYMGSVVSLWTTNQDPNIFSNISNSSSLGMVNRPIFRLPGTRYVNLSSVNCNCSMNFQCQSPVAIYQMDYVWNTRIRADIDYIVPGSIAGCSNFDSLLFSSLLCFYSNAECNPIVMKYIKDSYYYNVENPEWFNPQPLIYDSTKNHYPPNSSIASIVKKLMIESWNSSYSYERFYSICSPVYCVYSELSRTNSIVSVFIVILSMLGGLTVTLRLISPWIVKFIYKLFKKTNQRRNQQRIPMNFNEIKTMAKRSYSFIIEFNMFPRHDVDRERAKKMGQWSTRLYLSLFILGVGILTLYTVIQPTISTKVFERPSFDLYNELYRKRKDTLKCSCSTIASKYQSFVRIQANFHEICHENLLNTIPNNDERDYRRFLFSHLKYIEQLCDHSVKTVTDSIDQFLSSLFVTSNVLSENEFNIRLNSQIEQRKQITPNKFMNLLSLIRNVNHGNSFVSVYGTNYQYYSNWFWNSAQEVYFANEPIIYDNKCSCGLKPNCTRQASFSINDSLRVPIKGFRMGCTPSESLRESTLECFYDESCLNSIKQYTNLTLNLLSIEQTQYSINTTISQLIENLFVEQWLISINYSSYYNECSPLLCSYSYNQDFALLYVIAVVLGLQGGLAIVLKWISPKLIHVSVKIYEKQNRNVIQPIGSIPKNSSGIQVIQNNPPPNRSFIKLTIILFIFLILTTGLIVFSIYIIRQPTNNNLSTTTTTAVIITTTSVLPIALTTSTIAINSTTYSPMCQLQFNLASKYVSGYTTGLKSPVLADFNNDNLLDVAFFNYGTSSLHVLIGDGRGNYTVEWKTYVGTFTTWAFIIAASDFDHDDNIDIVFTSENRDYVYFLFGNGNGTFQNVTTYFMGTLVRTRGIGIYDFNNDSHFDIALASQSENTIYIILGYGNGSFTDKMPYYAGPNTNPSSLTLADVNNDGFQDIIYNNIMTRSVGVLLGKGDGTFQTQIASFVGGYYNPSFIAVGDFNGDNKVDVAVSYSSGNRVGVVLGYGNGSMSEVNKFPTGNQTYYARIATGDFNNDGYSDVIIGARFPYSIYILVSYGNGDFNIQNVFSADFNGLYSWMNVIDLNGDECQDIVASDDTRGTIFFLLNVCSCQNNL